VAIAVILVAAFAGVGARLLRACGTLDDALVAARVGRRAEAEALASPVIGVGMMRSAAYDVLGVTAAIDGDLDSARSRFAQAGAGPERFGRVPWRDVVVDLLDVGRYERAELIAGRGASRSEEVALTMLHGVALTGLDRLADAKRAMGSGPLRTIYDKVRRGKTLLVGGVFRDERTLRLYSEHVAELSRRERAGRRAYLFDAAGDPLFHVAVSDAARGRVGSSLVALVGAPETGGLEARLDARDRRNHVTTTLDLGLQSVAHRALRWRRGTIVLLGMEGQVLAAVGRDDRRNRRGAEVDVPDPLDVRFPTASVAKIPTLVAALGDGRADDLFPYRCHDPLRIGGRPLYDWRRHGQVEDSQAALAMSCNLAFARLGELIGGAAVVASFLAFGFEDEPTDGPALGTIPSIAGERALAELSTGLSGPRSTPIGAAAIALAVATDGIFHEPFVIRRKTAIAGTVYDEHVTVARRVASEAVAFRVRRGMTLAVEGERGTARRARPTVLSLAAKTGTSGESPRFDAVIVGFIPAERPRYAFSVWVAGGGRASGPAAEITRTLVDGIHELEQERARDAW